MTLIRTLALLSVSLSAACAAIPEAHPRSAADGADRSIGRVGRCRDLAVLAAIEVYPVGLNPQCRFAAVGTVETGRAGTPIERVARLQAEACALGADAVIGWSEQGMGAGLATGYQDGTTYLASARRRPVEASGIAVVYTAGSPSSNTFEK